MCSFTRKQHDDPVSRLPDEIIDLLVARDDLQGMWFVLFSSNVMEVIEAMLRTQTRKHTTDTHACDHRTCDFFEKCCLKAAQHGWLAIVKWLPRKQEFAPDVHEDMCMAAVKGHQLEILKYLLTTSIPKAEIANRSIPFLWSTG